MRERMPGPHAGGRSAAGRRQALVVESHERDHVAHVVVLLDPARGRALLVREDRVVDDAAACVEIRPYGLREREVRRVVAVEVADLAAADTERELAAAARAGFD